MNRRVKAGTVLQIVDVLRGAADLVGRSPYPLVEASDRLGIVPNDWRRGPDDWRLVLAREARDHVRAECGARVPARLILLEAAQRLADCVSASPRRDRRSTVDFREAL